MADLFLRSTAEIDGPYRYRLGREWGPGPTLLVCGINPSIADAVKPDPTLTRCVGFARSLGCGSLTMINLFAWISTPVAGLASAEDPIGPRNDEVLDEEARRVGSVVCAWGVPDKLPARLRSRYFGVVNRWRVAGVRTLALRVTAGGHPEHPLYLPASCRPVAWDFMGRAEVADG